MTALLVRTVALVGVISLSGTASAGSAGRPAPVEVARLSCAVDLDAGSFSCLPADGTTRSGIAAGEVALVSQSVRAVQDGWAAHVAVRNGSVQTLGAIRGPGADPDGLRVIALAGPTVTAGTGSVRATGPSALSYASVLAPGESSGVQALQFAVSGPVRSFSFPVSVMAVVAPPRGWIDLTAPSAFVLQGGTLTFSAVARTATGVRLPGAFLSLISSNTGVATITPTGVLTASSTTAGTTTVTARAGSTVATAPVCVAPDLAVGGVYHYVLERGTRFCLPGGASGNAEYTVMPTNQSTTSAIQIGVTGTGIVAVSGPPTPFDGPQDAPAGRTLAADGAVGQAVDDEALAAADAADFARVEQDHAETAPLLQRAAARIGTGAGGTDDVIPPGVPAVGAQWSLNVASGCSGAVDNRTGVVRAVSAHAIIVDDTNNPAGGQLPWTNTNGAVTTADSLANRFERIVWPAITTAFGEPTDLDSNGRVVLFYTRGVNELDPPASGTVSTYGYFTSRDLFSSDASGCSRSNQGEILYMLVPDPTGAVNSNVRQVALVESNTTRQAGRELVRLVNASRRIYVVNAVSFEESWLDLGLAGVGEELMFYRTAPGLAPRQNINLSTLTSGTDASRRVAAFNSFANLCFSRYRPYLQRPDVRFPYTNPTSTNSTDIDGNQGATWAFLRYAADRRNGDDNTFWSSLISQTSGLDNLQGALGLSSRAELLTWFRDWNVASYADDAVSGVSAQYQQTSWNYRSVFGGLGGFPLLARPLSNSTGLTLSYPRGGSTSFLRAGVPTGAFATFDLSGTFTSPVPVSVVRTK